MTVRARHRHHLPPGIIWGGTTVRSKAPPWPHATEARTVEPTTQRHRAHPPSTAARRWLSLTTAGLTANVPRLAGNRDTGDPTVCRRPPIVAGRSQGGQGRRQGRPQGHRRLVGADRHRGRPRRRGSSVLIVAQVPPPRDRGRLMRAWRLVLLLAGDEILPTDALARGPLRGVSRKAPVGRWRLCGPTRVRPRAAAPTLSAPSA